MTEKKICIKILKNIQHNCEIINNYEEWKKAIESAIHYLSLPKKENPC